MNTERVNEYFRRWPKEVFVGHYEDERDPEGEEKLAFILALGASSCLRASILSRFDRL